jgi:hypothetical protein
LFKETTIIVDTAEFMLKLNCALVLSIVLTLKIAVGRVGIIVAVTV